MSAQTAAKLTEACNELCAMIKETRPGHGMPIRAGGARQAVHRIMVWQGHSLCKAPRMVFLHRRYGFDGACETAGLACACKSMLT